MTISLTTTTQLLHDLRQDRSGDAWRLLVDRYSPVLCGVARRLGLRQPDAEDATQQTLLELAREVQAGRFVHGRDHVRCWTLAVLRNRVRDLQRVGARGPGGQASTPLEEIPDDHMLACWNLERERRVLIESIARLRQETSMAEATVRAFELLAVFSVPAHEAARECGMSRNEVYVARSRVLARLRPIVAEVDAGLDDAPL